MIAERIVNVAAAHAGDVMFVHPNPAGSEFRDQSIIVAAPQCRMSFLRRPEGVFDSQMNLHAPAFKPAAAALGQFRWFRNFLPSTSE